MEITGRGASLQDLYPDVKKGDSCLAPWRSTLYDAIILDMTAGTHRNFNKLQIQFL